MFLSVIYLIYASIDFNFFINFFLQPLKGIFLLTFMDIVMTLT